MHYPTRAKRSLRLLLVLITFVAGVQTPLHKAYAENSSRRVYFSPECLELLGAVPQKAPRYENEDVVSEKTAQMQFKAVSVASYRDGEKVSEDVEVQDCRRLQSME